MYSITFLFHNSSSAVGYYFTKYDNAAKIISRFNAWKEDPAEAAKIYQSDKVHLLKVEDDFGSIGVIDFKDISCVNLADIAKREDQNGDLQIIKHKSMMLANRKAASDPEIRAMGTIQPATSLITQ